MGGERPLPVEGGLPVPLPLVTDLDGDGKNEVVVLADGGMLIRVLSVPVASGETLVDPWIIHSTELRPTRRLGRDERAVAMAAGYLEPPVNARDPGSSRQQQVQQRQQQRIVVVGEDSSVTCFNHQLGRLWTTSLAHEGSSSGEGGSFVIDQVAITVAHSVRKLDDRGRPKPGTGEGLIVVGISMRHRDGRFHHSRAGRDPSGGSPVDGADPLGVHVEAFVEGEEDSRDTVEEEKMSEEEKGRRAAEHFSLFALDGETGEVRWSHGGGAHHGAQDKQNGGDGGGGGGGGIRDYDYFDFGFDLDYPGFGDDLLYNQTEGAAAALAFEGLAAVAGAVGGGSGQRTRDGLEAVELSTGKPLSAVALPAAAGTDAGVYVDLNGDGVVDHVQAVGTRGGQGWGHLHEGVAMGHLSEEPTPSQPARRFLPPCYALAVSGLPPREQLFNASLCHDAGALFEVQERLSKPNSRSSSRSLDLEVGAASPAIIPRDSAGVAAAAATGAATARSSSGAGRGARSGGGGGGGGVGGWGEGPARFDAVFAVSSGVVSSYDDEGRLKWQDRRGPKWTRKDTEGGDPSNGGGYVVPFTLEVGWPGRGRGRIINPSPGAEERILVVGQDKMCVYDRGGRLAGSTPLAAPPSQRPVLGDFDGDGVADVLVVGWSGAVAGYALAPDPGVRAMFVAVLALVAAMLVVAAVHVPPPPSSSSSRGGGRATQYGTGLAGGKSKRATD
ncbi:aldehyde dehydrogenase, putative [Ectocarpus siliculosus]|uniref:Aldehyde dehydrogenase, putative n=1 Tax=Ectocarpus siliculosus TaxID=2880 RepID=D8LK18_ECTSI|nr:aldehyde dehydrogenase, putative [Ectocarpus siliculosus]|eukprot:CBN74487.1 aldehyde dehydrogenase, putative [Ectocarpus siliculosus]